MESSDLVQMGLYAFFDNHASINLIAATDCIHDLLFLARQHQPDVILMDSQLIEDHGMENFSRLHRQSPESKVLILSLSEEWQPPLQMSLPSTAGIISKYSSCRLLLNAITAIYAGKDWLNHSTLPVKHAQPGLAKPPTLSDNHPTTDCFKLSRTSRVASLACKGLSAKEIGRQLSITEKSVRNQLSSIYKKVGVRKQVQLCIKAPLHNFFSNSFILWRTTCLACQYRLPATATCASVD
ncbi:MAG: response regulator transcription factor [Proteobacteria bacterium]|nr:response regulator transcription factor [Pseudomonadota bacterium]